MTSLRQLFRSRGQNRESFQKYSRVCRTTDGKCICKGCESVEELFEIERRLKRSPDPLKRIVHNNYAELDGCASSGCGLCRLFRQALIFEKFTPKEVISSDQDALRGLKGPVMVSLSSNRSELMHADYGRLKISISSPSGQETFAWSTCTNNYRMHQQSTDMAKPCYDPEDQHVADQAAGWLKNCEGEAGAIPKANGHIDCHNLRLSARNPTRLLQILSDSMVQLIESPESQVRYCALSYCWGSSSSNRDDQSEKIKCGKTTKNNVAERLYQPFHRSVLPKTIEDAIALVWRMELEYIWVDSVCLMQDDKAEISREIATMQRVYGNACFTLCVCSSSRASDGLFFKREAWKYEARGFILGQLWIHNTPKSLNEVRAGCPLSSRGWTLQEECLSPRVLYWSNHGMYWSCAMEQWTEDAGYTSKPIHDSDLLSQSHGRTGVLAPPQEFLRLCRHGPLHELHVRWLDIVESYASRILSYPSDRFPALSGIASRYYERTSSENAAGQEYIAGHWRTSLADELSWSVQPPFTERSNMLRDVAPSWSWASLPFGAKLTMIKVENRGLGVLFDLRETLVETAGPERFGAIKMAHLRVRGRLRTLYDPDSLEEMWPEVDTSDSGIEKFKIPDPEKCFYAINKTDSQILSVESHRLPVLGKLDYLPGRSKPEIYYCLEMTSSYMLLLNDIGRESKFCRVGVAHNYRPDFFVRAEIRELILC
jgi:hypothetical protein